MNNHSLQIYNSTALGLTHWPSWTYERDIVWYFIWNNTNPLFWWTVNDCNNISGTMKLILPGSIILFNTFVAQIVETFNYITPETKVSWVYWFQSVSYSVCRRSICRPICRTVELHTEFVELIQIPFCSYSNETWHTYSLGKPLHVCVLIIAFTSCHTRFWDFLATSGSKWRECWTNLIFIVVYISMTFDTHIQVYNVQYVFCMRLKYCHPELRTFELWQCCATSGT